METDEIIKELRAARAELERRYPTFDELYEHLKSREKEFADRLVCLAPVPQKFGKKKDEDNNAG